jgi:hypothetical protein
MKSVNIAELKNRLSVYLNDVKAGEEILVRDRENRPTRALGGRGRGVAGTRLAGKTALGPRRS